MNFRDQTSSSQKRGFRVQAEKLQLRTNSAFCFSTISHRISNVDEVALQPHALQSILLAALALLCGIIPSRNHVGEYGMRLVDRHD